MRTCTNVLLITLLMPTGLLHAESVEKEFHQNCKKCHGDDGRGHTMVGKMVKAADLTSDSVAKQSDAELAAVISKGKGKMSGYADKLGGDAGVAEMVSYVRSLKK